MKHKEKDELAEKVLNEYSEFKKKILDTYQVDFWTCDDIILDLAPNHPEYKKENFIIGSYGSQEPLTPLEEGGGEDV